MKWVKIINATDSGNTIRTEVLLRFGIDRAPFQEVVWVESYIRDRNGMMVWLVEKIEVENDKQAEEIIFKFDSKSATHFLDREIKNQRVEVNNKSNQLK